MNFKFTYLVIFFSVCLGNSSSALSADCTGGWKVLPNYHSSQGGPCKILGLDTHRGTCQGGNFYETLCDDAANGQYRICQGKNRCLNLPVPSQSPPKNAFDCNGNWNILKNYNPRQGAPCQILGLDTHQGTCQPGQKYETLCDDAANGQYRTCQNTTPCQTQSIPMSPSGQRTGDCNGAWSILPNYHSSLGGPCKILGLNTNQGTCQENQSHETLCDDASDGRYRICQGSKKCRKYPHRFYRSNKINKSKKDCDGTWKRLNNYNRRQGSPCEILGLNSFRGTCEAGYSFETLCDETSDGRFKICEGSRRCK